MRNLKQLNDKVELLRRAFGWNVPILARQWLNIAVAGTWMFGKAPQEVRVWIVDKAPAAWSFHYLHAVPNPSGFPPSVQDLQLLGSLARQVAATFRSRLIAADLCEIEKAIGISWRWDREPWQVRHTKPSSSTLQGGLSANTRTWRAMRWEANCDWKQRLTGIFDYRIASSASASSLTSVTVGGLYSK